MGGLSGDTEREMLVSAIVAVALNGVIGDGNDIPWRLSGDLKFFKRVTTGHHVIMGRKTYDSIGRPLPNRTNIILTRDPFFAADGVLTAHDLNEALEMAYDHDETEAFIIGGGEVYRQGLRLCDRLYLTRVHTHAEGSVYFPELDMSEWTLVLEERFSADERNDYDYAICRYERR